jgi:hypothetical protein
MLEELAKGQQGLLYRKLRARFAKSWMAAAAYSLLFAMLAGHLGANYAALVTAAAGLAVVAHRRPRAWLAHYLRDYKLRQRTELALLVAMGEKAPFVGEIKPREIGEEVVARVCPGGDLAELERSAGRIAAALRCRSVRIKANEEDASLARMIVVRRDPLREPVEGAEVFDGRTFSLYERIPLGVDEEGNVVGVPLYEHHFLIGGEPGAGKSVTLSVLLSAAALDPHCELWLMDGKLIELSAFERVATRFVGDDLDQASAVLDELIEEMMARYLRLKERNQGSKVQRGDGERLVVLAIDELQMYVADLDKKASAAFNARLHKLVSLGRAAGIIVIAATQKPSADIVPTALRDMFSFRLAHRCSTRDASDTILGAGWAAEGFSASSIDSSLRGVGLLLAEAGTPRRIRSYFLSEVDVARNVRRAYQLRREAGR